MHKPSHWAAGFPPSPGGLVKEVSRYGLRGPLESSPRIQFGSDLLFLQIVTTAEISSLKNILQRRRQIAVCHRDSLNILMAMSALEIARNKGRGRVHSSAEEPWSVKLTRKNLNAIPHPHPVFSVVTVRCRSKRSQIWSIICA